MPSPVVSRIRGSFCKRTTSGRSGNRARSGRAGLMDTMRVVRIAGLTVRGHHPQGRPTLVYLPGIHGDWTLVTSFRCAVAPPLEFLELAYPDTTEWTITDYARAVATALNQLEIRRYWLLAESFGSLVAWALLEQVRSEHGPEMDRSPLLVAPEGLILAGGFVRHPWPWGAVGLAAVGRNLPQAAHRLLLRGYAWFAGWRHRHAPETRDTVEEFLARRTPENRRAIQARLHLVAGADYRTVASRIHLPVYALAGGLDPLVPWGHVWRWLRRYCPGFRAARLFWWADHNVLGTAPRESAAQVIAWMEQASGAGEEPGRSLRKAQFPASEGSG